MFVVVTKSCYKLMPLPSILIEFFPIFQPFYFHKLTLLVGDCTTLIRPKQSVCIHKNLGGITAVYIDCYSLPFASAHCIEIAISFILAFFFWLSLIPRYKFSILAANAVLASHIHAAFEFFFYVCYFTMMPCMEQ